MRYVGQDRQERSATCPGACKGFLRDGSDPAARCVLLAKPPPCPGPRAAEPNSQALERHWEPILWGRDDCSTSGSSPGVVAPPFTARPALIRGLDCSNRLPLASTSPSSKRGQVLGGLVVGGAAPDLVPSRLAFCAKVLSGQCHRSGPSVA